MIPDSAASSLSSAPEASTFASVCCHSSAVTSALVRSTCRGRLSNSSRTNKEPGIFRPSAPGRKDPAPAPAGGSGTSISLDKLSIKDGQIAITDHEQGQPRTVYDHIDLTLSNYRPGAPVDLDLAVHTPGEGAQELRLKGTVGPVADDDPAKTPVKATLSLKEVGIEGLRSFLGEAASSGAAGSLSGETQIANASGNLSAAGKLRIDRARFNNLDVGYPIALDYDVTAKLPEGLFTITRGAIQLGSTPLSIAGTINTNRTPARIDLNLKSGSVSIAEIARLASALGVAFGTGTNVAGNISVDLHATGSAEKPALNGTIAGRDLNISGKDVPQPVQVKALDIVLTPDEIRSNEFAAVSGKTTVNSRFSVRQYTSASPAIDLGLRAPNASLPEIQSIAKAYGATGIDQINGQGSLNFDIRAQGTTDSLSSPDMMRALNGTLNLDFSPLQLKGFNIAQELASIGGFSAGSDNKTISDLLKLTGHVVIKNGIAQSDDLQGQLAIGNLAAAGTADLAAETLNLKVSAVISKAVSDKVGSTRVGGYMRTVLSNPDGELVIPALLTGTFKQPKFSPDVQAFAQMQKQRLLPSLANPKGGLSGILGALPAAEARSRRRESGAACHRAAAETCGRNKRSARWIVGRQEIFGFVACRYVMEMGKLRSVRAHVQQRRNSREFIGLQYVFGNIHCRRFEAGNRPPRVDAESLPGIAGMVRTLRLCRTPLHTRSPATLFRSG